MPAEGRERAQRQGDGLGAGPSGMVMGGTAARLAVGVAHDLAIPGELHGRVWRWSSVGFFPVVGWWSPTTSPQEED